MQDFIRSVARLRDKVTKSKFEQDLHKATSNEESFPDEAILKEVTDYAYYEEHYQLVFDHIVKKLQSPKDKWRKIIKALQLTEYIVKDGNAKFIKDLHKQIFLVRALEEFNHFSDNTDRGKPIRALARRITEQIAESMKNIESLAVKTKVKMQDKFIKERDTIEEERKHAHHRSNGQGNTHQRPTHIEKGVVHERQNDYFKVEYSKNDVPADHGARNRQRLNQNEAPVHSSQIDPKLYDNPNADKEVLNLVESQFGQGFLDLNFEDDEPEQHTKKPLSNPGNKNRQDDQFDFGGPKSVKQPKSKQTKFEFDDYESQYSTAGNRKNKQAVFDDEIEFDAKRKPSQKAPQLYNDEDGFNNQFENFEDFNNFDIKDQPANPYIQQSEVLYQKGNSGSGKNDSPSNLQNKGFNDDFLDFDLLGDVKEVYSRVTSRLRQQRRAQTGFSNLKSK